MITMRLFSEEKRSGTIELLLTSPIRDWEIIMGKWFGALILVHLRAGHVGSQYRVAIRIRQSGLEADPGSLSGPDPARRTLLAIGTFISSTTKNQIIAGGVTFAVCLLLWVLGWFTAYDSAGYAKVVAYLSIVTHFETFAKGRDEPRTWSSTSP